ncbi:DUF302 domain-containing protein [uncultured Methylibium sp.]|uniref:DUF302 domain-containing protein n=1 Tax=uncultured Methylibium sp. TaxID=381093 RepID=UPI0025D8B349|nr:DUF302 domain-containing protein [uncultured Methylibium sp.]
MNILLDSRKPFDVAVADLQRSVAAHGFSVLHMHALSDTLAAKGHSIDKRVAVLEVCNATVASEMLTRDASISLALPCRVAVFEHADGTRLGTIAPTTILEGFGLGPEVDIAASLVERTLRQILVDAA